MSKITIIEGNSNNKDNVRAIMVKGEKGEQGDLNHNDIIDNLTSSATDKVLSAKQGKILKDISDENTTNISRNIEDIENEKNVRQNADNTLQNNINSEVSARENADSNLQSQISGLANGSPLVASSVAGMTDTTRVYVNTTDGNWYYYNGSTWVIGGVYQSTGIADYSIGLPQLKNEVINDRYENVSGNKLNPFSCLDNKGLTAADGSIVDNASYWLIDKIYLNNGEVLKFFLNNNGHLTERRMYRLCAYQLDGTFIETLANDNYIYTATQDCYVLIAIKKTSITFENRFNCGIRIFTEENPYISGIRLPFQKYTSSKKENINLNVDFNDINNDLLSKMPINETMIFERGSYYSIDGKVFNEGTNRIRTNLIVHISKGTTIKTLENDVDFVVLFYNIDSNGYVSYIPNSSTGFISNYKFEENSNVGICVRYTDNREIDLTEVETLANKIEIKAPVDNILDYIDENTKVGTQLAYSGEKINLNNKCYVSSNIGIPTRTQDGCIYNGINFEFGTNGTFTVTDMETLTVYGTFDLDQKATILPHCNSACFGNEFYDVNDEFPLLYVNAYNNTDLPKGTCYVHRIQRDENNEFSTTLVQTISIGFTGNALWEDNTDIRPYGNFAVDTDHNFLYVFTMRTGLNVTRFFKFRLPRLSDGTSVILAQNDILDYFDTTYEPYIQGCQYYQNKIYSSCGIDNIVANSSSIRVIDLVSKGEVANIPTSSITVEPETVAFYNNKMVFGGSQLLYIDF